MRLRVRKGVEIKEMGDETLVLVLEDNSFYRFNESAAIILKIVRKEKNVDKVILQYSKLYSISLKQAKKDVGIFIKDCIRKKILE